MINIEKIFVTRTFNKEPITTIQKPVVIEKPLNSELLNKSDKLFPSSKIISMDSYGVSEYQSNLFGFNDDDDNGEDVDVLTREDEIGLFKSYKIGQLYADKFNNSYKIIKRSDNTITYIMNIELDKMEKREITISRKEFLEKMQYNPSYKQEYYAAKYVED